MQLHEIFKFTLTDDEDVTKCLLMPSCLSLKSASSLTVSGILNGYLLLNFGEHSPFGHEVIKIFKTAQPNFDMSSVFVKLF